MLSTTLVMTRRSTVGAAGDCAVARPTTRASPPTAKIPVPTAPSRSTSRRLMAASSTSVRGDYARLNYPMSIQRAGACRCPAGDPVVVEQGPALHEAGDDIAVELRHRVAAGAGQAVGQDEAALAVVADPVAGELLIDERLHPGIGFFGQLHHVGAAHLAVESERDRHADAAMNRRVADEHERAEHLPGVGAA